VHLSLYNTFNNVSIFNSYRHQMDTYMDTTSMIDKLNKVSRDFYSEVKQRFDNNIKKLHDGFFPKEFINYQDRLISNFIKLSPEQCWDLLNLSLRTLEFILRSKIEPKEEKLRIYFFTEELSDYAQEGEKDENYPSIQNELSEKGNVGLILGYELLSKLSAHRLNAYLDQYPNAKKALKIYYIDFLSKYPDTKADAENSFNELEKYSSNIYKKKVKKSLKKGNKLNIKDYKDDLGLEIFQIVKRKFSGSISDDVMLAAKGENFTNFVPNAVAKKLISRYIKESKFYNRHSLTLDKPAIEDSSLTRIDFIESNLSFYELIEILESQEILDYLTDYIINNPDYLTDLQKQVLSLVLEQGKSFQEAGNEMEIKKQTAHELYQAAIKKLRKVLTLN